MSAAADPAREPVVVAAVRTPVGRAFRGALRDVRADELAATCLRAALARASGVEPSEIDDVVLGCAIPEGPQGLNMARTAALRAGLPVAVPALTLTRFCASGLEALVVAADRIAAGRCRVVLAGGAESMSAVPMTGFRFLPNPALVAEMPQAYVSMGMTAEEVAERHGVSRADQDAFALASHRKAVAAQDSGRFADELVPVDVVVRRVGAPGETVTATTRIDADEGPRRDTSAEALSALAPAFRKGGSVTAGNASQTSDGAAALLVTSRAFAAERGLDVLGVLRGYEVVGVAPEVMGIGPVEALPRLLARTGVAQHDVALFELNEAFAAQALAVQRALRIPDERLNVNGGAIALGHPLGATGAKLCATLLHELRRRDARYGVVTLCVGGGMGVAALFERT